MLLIIHGGRYTAFPGHGARRPRFNIPGAQCTTWSWYITLGIDVLGMQDAAGVIRISKRNDVEYIGDAIRPFFIGVF